ncbi:Protein of unknown function [Cotesia congregata]|uniref:Uncharacterized protein n=1 Tax=Cotesia congregata TaxID=51543 RepID=A0A8J2H5M5_COTCN|nr:Protein of unknown function [Cotesia congregata]
MEALNNAVHKDYFKLLLRIRSHFSNGSSIHTSEIKRRLINHTMELIDKGFKNNMNPVIITSDLVDDQVVNGNIDNVNPLIVVNSDFIGAKIKGYHPSYPMYILKFESDEKLIKASWVLKFLGRFEILVSYYLCYDNDKDSTIVYTLNPYSQYAPRPWKQVKLADSNRKTNSTLLSLQYPKDVKKSHKNVYFDKNKYLNGHTIKLLDSLNIQNSTQQDEQNEIDKYMKLIKQFKDVKLTSLPDYIKVNTSIHVIENDLSSLIIKMGFDNRLSTSQYDAHNQMTQLADINYNFNDFVTQYQELHFSIITKKTDHLTAITEIDVNLNFIVITILVLLLIAVLIILSKESIFKKYFVFWTKKNWALKDKIDKARSIPVETGLINHFIEEKIKKDRKMIKKMAKIKEAENYERVDFENLMFYFIVFAAILLWSLVIFGIELLVHYNNSKYLRRQAAQRKFIGRLRASP